MFINSMAEGYSGTPLGKKLGYKEGFKVAFYNKPEHYFSLFNDLPKIEEADFEQSHDLDLIHVFIKTNEELDTIGPLVKNKLKKNGLAWFSWPKKSSDLITELNRDIIRESILKVGLVDTKVCAVDQDWSGLKFVFRTKDR